jgi:hypothetical protein
VVVVPTGEKAFDDAIRVALGSVVLGAQATVELLADAKAAGVTCATADVACWLRLAELGGYESVVFFVDGTVTVASASGTHHATVGGPGAVALQAATRRAMGLAGELRVTVTPLSAKVSIDGADVDTVEGLAIVSVALGDHVVGVRHPGYVDVVEHAIVEAGAPVELAVVLAPHELATSSPSSTRTALSWTGGALLGLSAVAAGTLVAVGQGPYLACYEASPPQGCREGGTIRQTADDTALAAVVVGVAGVAAGLGIWGVSLVVE